MGEVFISEVGAEEVYISDVEAEEVSISDVKAEVYISDVRAEASSEDGAEAFSGIGEVSIFDVGAEETGTEVSNVVSLGFSSEVLVGSTGGIEVGDGEEVGAGVV